MNVKKIFILLLCTSFITGCFYNTKPNEVGVRTSKIGLIEKKGIQEQIYAPGSTYIFPPIINDWHTFDINLQNIEMTISLEKGDILGRDDLKFKTIDGNDISLDMIISYRVDPQKTPYILGYVARNDIELRNKIVRVVARSRPRDIFGQLETEEFYNAELRAKKADEVKDKLNNILSPYGIIVERVLTKDYRFNTQYQKAIEDKKVADQLTEKLKSETLAKEEEYKRKLEKARGEVYKMVAAADGDYAKEIISADAYYTKQESIAKAITEEGKAESQGIQKLKEALALSGGKIMVKLEMAKALKGKRIVLLPSGSGQNIDLKTFDVNKFLEIQGLQSTAAQQNNKIKQSK